MTTNLVISAKTDSVFLNGTSYSGLNLTIPQSIIALYWDGEKGWIENADENGNYLDNTNIDTLPEWAKTCVSAYLNNLPAPPTPLEECKNKAVTLLRETDWAEFPSVSDKTSPVYLVNIADFIQYRIAIRALVISPVANPVWPTQPTAQWSI